MFRENYLHPDPYGESPNGLFLLLMSNSQAIPGFLSPVKVNRGQVTSRTLELSSPLHHTNVMTSEYLSRIGKWSSTDDSHEERLMTLDTTMIVEPQSLKNGPSLDIFGHRNAKRSSVPYLKYWALDVGWPAFEIVLPYSLKNEMQAQMLSSLHLTLILMDEVYRQ
ncbi:hypothetical protein TNCV_543571 [Trichonephila clavipes]|nr:hypothetical protein TNCV_543571 [Trichonephila clavipes]